MKANPQQWTKARVVAELQQRFTDKLSIRLDNSPEDQQFVEAVYDCFESWDSAFEAAGIDTHTRLVHYWTTDEVTKRIRLLAERGVPINTLNLERNHPRLWNAARRLFTNIEKAVEASGYSYKEVRKRNRWSKEEILRRIRRMYARGRDISQTGISRTDSKLLAAGQKYYGAWTQAVKAAGIDYADVKKRHKSMKKKVKGAKGESKPRNWQVFVVKDGRVIATQEQAEAPILKRRNNFVPLIPEKHIPHTGRRDTLM
jgi:hypothetical protein